MQPFTKLSSLVTPLIEDDINTDQIIPSQYLRDIHADLGHGLFAFLRRSPSGQINHSCSLEDPRYKGSQILLVGENFGCGSSREHAVWALQEFGFRCVIGLSFAELFRENCLKNGLLPLILPKHLMTELIQHLNFAQDNEPAMIEIDLEQCAIFDKEAKKILGFDFRENERQMLLAGLDDIGVTLKEMDQVKAWQSRVAAQTPWLIKPIEM
jgi:3-isopropylmalate/(R)-2-methylmalate dehydratase small subunit